MLLPSPRNISGLKPSDDVRRRSSTYGSEKLPNRMGGKTLTIETGKLAAQANASCTVRYGDTVILATAVLEHDPRENIDFFRCPSIRREALRRRQDQELALHQT